MSNNFYFLRHGQTDYNLREVKVDHPPDIPLNDTGRTQARAVEPLIASLPIKTICFSPMRRAVETKEIVSGRHSAIPHLEIPELGECSALIWKEMPSLKEHALLKGSEHVQGFLERVQKGLDLALSNEAPVLIVAHGGVHWALCTLLNVQGHHWAIDNCIPVHFYKSSNGLWLAKKLI